MDPYVYPGTTVLRNLRGIRDPDEAATVEALATAKRLTELHEKPGKGRFDLEHLRAIHRALFQDVYDWAGEFRTVNIRRSGQFYFAYAEHIASTLTSTFDVLKRENHLAGLDREQFSARAGYFMGELNAIHPFRDGNGRTQREFIRQLAVRNGLQLDWSRVTRAQIYEASETSFSKADNSGLARVIGLAIAAEA